MKSKNYKYQWRGWRDLVKGVWDVWSWWIYKLIVALGLEPFFEKVVNHLDWWLRELSYRVNKLQYILKTPRVIRNAERELHRFQIKQELAEEMGESYFIDEGDWVPGFEGEMWLGESPPFDDDDGREWWLRDPDNRDDR